MTQKNCNFLNSDFLTLYEVAKQNLNPRTVSRMMRVGRVSTALLSKMGKIYKGICIETKCSLGMCAEKNAIAQMISNGDFEIDKICTVDEDGVVMPPCGACREFMIQLGSASKDIEVLLDGKGKTAKLGALLPEYPYL